MSSLCHELSLIISILFSYCCNTNYSFHVGNGFHGPWALYNISSEQVLDKDKDGNCYFPPFCNLNVTKCTIPKVSIHDMTFSKFYNEYYIPRKPVIIQFCPGHHSHCDLSSVVNASNIRWPNIASVIPRDNDTLEFLLQTDRNGTIDSRTKAIYIQALDPRGLLWGPILSLWAKRFEEERKLYHSIHQPSFFEQVDFYTDLIGYLSTSDKRDSFPHKWVIVGVAGSGSTFHIDYYCTSFWNMIVEGSKYWISIPSHDVLKIWNHSKEVIQQIQDLETFEFIDQFYVNGLLDGDTHYECLQEKGDMVYMPAGDMHLTANLERTVSVSQNLITKQDYDKTFKILTGVRVPLHHAKLDDQADVPILYAMRLCIALNHYDKQLFDDSACADAEFLKRLDTGTHDKTQANSQLYLEACRFSTNHAQYSDFRH
eukprot:339657_1